MILHRLPSGYLSLVILYYSSARCLFAVYHQQITCLLVWCGFPWIGVPPGQCNWIWDEFPRIAIPRLPFPGLPFAYAAPWSPISPIRLCLFSKIVSFSMSLVVVDRVAVSLPCSPKTAPLNLHDATVQALLSSMPQLTSIQPNHHTFRTYASSTPGWVSFQCKLSQRETWLRIIFHSYESLEGFKGRGNLLVCLTLTNSGLKRQRPTSSDIQSVLIGQYY